MTHLLDQRLLATWNTARPPKPQQLRETLSRLREAGEDFETEKDADDDLEQGTWHSDYSLDKTDRGIHLLNPIIREFILHYSRKQQHLLQGWRRKTIDTVERIGVDTHKDVIRAHINDSHDVNQLIETLESLDVDEVGTPLPVKQFISLFSGPQQAAVPLPNGLFLFEGRSSWFGCDVDEKTVGIGTEFHRKRATSTTWLPQTALPWAVIPNLVGQSAIYTPYKSIQERRVPQPFFLAHEIVSDGVLGVDVQAIEGTALEREVILRPFLHFHVVGDSITLLPGNDGELNMVRVLHTHVYSQKGGCPRCTGIKGYEPDLERMMANKMRKIDDIAVIRHMQEIRSFNDRLRREHLERMSESADESSESEETDTEIEDESDESDESDEDMDDEETVVRKEIIAIGLAAAEHDDERLVHSTGMLLWKKSEWKGIPPGRQMDTLMRNQTYRNYYWISAPITDESKQYLTSVFSDMITAADVKRHMRTQDLYKSMLPEDANGIPEPSEQEKRWSMKVIKDICFMLVHFCWSRRARDRQITEALANPRNRAFLDAAIKEGVLRLPLDGEFEYILSLLPDYIVEFVQDAGLFYGWHVIPIASEARAFAEEVIKWVDNRPLPDSLRPLLNTEFALLRRTVNLNKEKLDGYSLMATYLIQRVRPTDLNSLRFGRYSLHAYHKECRLGWQGEADYVIQLMTYDELKSVHSRLEAAASSRSPIYSRSYKSITYIDQSGYSSSMKLLARTVMGLIKKRVIELRDVLYFRGILRDTRDPSTESDRVIKSRMDRDSAALAVSFLGATIHPPAFGPVERHDNKNPKRAFEEEKKDEDGDEEMKSEEEERRVKSRTQGRASKLY